MVRSLMNDTATLVRVPYARTKYHQAPDFDEAEEIHTGKCSVQPFLGVEDEIDRDTRVSQCRLISDDTGFYGATALDYIEFNDEMWKIDGRPFIWRHGSIHHIELNMRKVEG